MQHITEDTDKDPTLTRLKQQIQKGLIPKSLKDLTPYRKIFGEVSISGLILKGNKIILPENLWQVAIQKAHQGGHPGMNCFKGRIRSHFWFPRLDSLIEEKVKSCKPCQMFTNKTTKEPLKMTPLLENAWQDVSIDLFGPMPDKKHVVVIQDLSTCFPAAKIVLSIGGSHVIPAIEDIYVDFGYPDTHRTGNGPPFDSQEFNEFSRSHGIKHRKVFPYHPQANPVETPMSCQDLTMATRMGYPGKLKIEPC